MAGLSKISSTLKQGIARISEAVILENEDGEATGYDILKGYQTSWKEIRHRGSVCSKESKLAETRMVKARAYCELVDSCFQNWAHPQSLAHSLSSELDSAVRAIEQLGSKMTRLELALDKILEIKDLEQQRAWDQVRVQKLALQTQHHTKQYREELFSLEQEHAQARRYAARMEQQAAEALAPITFHVADVPVSASFSSLSSSTSTSTSASSFEFSSSTKSSSSSLSPFSSNVSSQDPVSEEEDQGTPSASPLFPSVDPMQPSFL